MIISYLSSDTAILVQMMRWFPAQILSKYDTQAQIRRSYGLFLLMGATKTFPTEKTSGEFICLTFIC